MCCTRAFLYGVLAVLSVVAVVPAAAPAQDIEGYIDLEQSIEQQIIRLEQIVGGDARALTQVAALQWLIELYDTLDRREDVERCYRRILDLYPNDVGTLNSYGRYLMDTVQDYERARKILYEAHEWARATDARAIDLGTTYQLRAEVTRRMGDYDDALNFADKALVLLSTERSGEVLRTKARTLVALERFDDAAATYLDLIALDDATNAEDVNEFKLILSRTTEYQAEEVDRYIAEAIQARREQYEARIELAGGTLVHFESSDGVVLEGTLRRATTPDSSVADGAVLFVGDTGSLRSEFTPFAQLLMIDGIATLAVDLRGHGGSRADSMLSYQTLSAYNRDRLPDDVVAAFRYLRGTLDVDADRITVVAAGDACSIVEIALYRGRIDAPVVYLSPSFHRADTELQTALSFHADHPILIIAAREDLSALRTISRLREGKPRDQLTTRIYPDAGHGLGTLRRTPEALEQFQQWLRDVSSSD